MKLYRMMYPSKSHFGGYWAWILAPDTHTATRIYSEQVLNERYNWGPDNLDSWEHLQDMYFQEYPLDQAGALPPSWQVEPDTEQRPWQFHKWSRP